MSGGRIPVVASFPGPGYEDFPWADVRAFPSTAGRDEFMDRLHDRVKRWTEQHDRAHELTVRYRMLDGGHYQVVSVGMGQQVWESLDLDPNDPTSPDDLDDWLDDLDE